MQAYVGGQVARGSTGVAVVNQDRLPDEEVFDLSILEALAAQGALLPFLHALAPRCFAPH